MSTMEKVAFPSNFLGIMSLFLLIVPSIFLMSSTSVYASTPKYEWSKRIGGTGNDLSRYVTTDKNDRVIIRGYVTGNADLNGDGDTTDESESATGYGGWDAYIAVFDKNGNFAWSKRLGGASTDFAVDVGIDSNNRIILTGYVTGNADLNGDGDTTDGGAENSVGFADLDGFITVFDSAGNYVWSKRIGGTAGDNVNAVYIDKNDRIIAGGYVTGVADLNADGDTTDGGAENSTGNTYMENFLSVFENTGAFVWAKRFGSVTKGNIVRGLVTDTNNNIAVSGYVTGDADLNGDGDNTDGGAESSAGYSYQDAFIAVYSSDGSYRWARRMGGNGYDTVTDLYVDRNNRFTLTGVIVGDVDLDSDGDTTDGGAESSVGFSLQDAFVAVFDNNGNYEWAKRLGGMTNDNGNGVAVDSNNRIIVTGVVSGAIDINGDGDTTDGGAESPSIYSVLDQLTVAFDSMGNNLWAKRFGNQNQTFSNGVAIDNTGRILVTGYLTGDIDFNNDSNSTNDVGESSTGYGLADAFILNLSIRYSPPLITLPTSLITNNAEPTINFSLDTASTCRLSPTSESYDSMSNDVACTGVGTTSASCTTPDLGEDGVKHVYVACVDEYDNKSDPSEYTITLDRESPTGSITINNGDAYAKNKNTTLTLSASDSLTTVSQMIISEDNQFLSAIWETYSPTKVFTLTARDGVKTVYVKYKDAAGNISEPVNDTIALDMTAPKAPRITDLGLITNIPDKSPLTYYFTSQTPYIKGKAEANSTVYFVYGKQTYSTKADSQGNFAISISDPELPRERVDLSYYAVDVAGNKSGSRKLTLIIGEENFPIQPTQTATATPTVSPSITPTITPNIPELTPVVYEIVDANGKSVVSKKVTINNQEYNTNAEGKVALETSLAENQKLEIIINGQKTEGQVQGQKIALMRSVTLTPEFVDPKETNYWWLWILIIIICAAIYYYSKRQREKD